MSDLDKSLQLLINFQKSVDRLTRDPLASCLKQQAQMLSSLTIPNQIAESVQLANKMFSEPFQQLEKQFASKFTLNTTAMSTFLTQYASMTEPFQKIANQWHDSTLLSFEKALTNDSYQQQLNSIQKSLASFSTAFGAITIHDKYVDIPEDLIPDGYSYTEVDSSITYASEESLPSSINVKKLSIPDAISVVCNLITLFFTIMTFLQAQQSSIQQQKNHEELVRLEQQQISLQEASNSIQEKENELLQLQIDATEKNTKYLIELLNQLQEVDEDSPATPSLDESAPSDTDSYSQCAHLQSQTAESQNPTKTDGAEHFDTESNKSE